MNEIYIYQVCAVSWVSYTWTDFFKSVESMRQCCFFLVFVYIYIYICHQSAVYMDKTTTT